MQTLWDKIADEAKLVTIEQRFASFDQDNPEVYLMFKQLAINLIDKGVKHYGAKAIFEVMRYEMVLKTSDPDFKLNNNYTALYARKFLADCPWAKDFFETRERSKFQGIAAAGEGVGGGDSAGVGNQGYMDAPTG